MGDYLIMKDVILIGGKSHLELIHMEDHINKFTISESESIVDSEEYVQVSNILGQYGIIPDNIFLLKSINPMDFIKNIVVDYIIFCSNNIKGERCCNCGRIHNDERNRIVEYSFHNGHIMRSSNKGGSIISEEFKLCPTCNIKLGEQ